MYKTYIGDKQLGRTKEGGFVVRSFCVLIEPKDENFKILEPQPSQELINHSPNGFNWGYGGSGPAQLSLALLYDVTQNSNLSIRLHHDFKFEIIANLEYIWVLEEIDILNWIKSKEN